MHGLALVDKGGVARDYKEPAQSGQSSDDVFADAVGKILLFPFPAHVVEGKHGDRRPIGQRQSRAWRLVNFPWRRVDRLNVVVWLLNHKADEAKPLAWNGTDQLPVCAAIADGRSRGGDAARGSPV